ncbi:LOW QUALITY PROTEIN: hypothetical protein BC938DRAFT_483626 [Jimgerdemannia flammicorona]|uniref:Thioesterase domain-containing protein n=1 Tax=Jimgerdemannia flammicorona TaxID=994334 RepID=A0A433QBM0_9FUNG|nr:LOW QUALITY PROTEIN: hypothetical protein BC938DRAFT_483626 [Jimgerdemannia flammicorona]
MSLELFLSKHFMDAFSSTSHGFMYLEACFVLNFSLKSAGVEGSGNSGLGGGRVSGMVVSLDIKDPFVRTLCMAELYRFWWLRRSDSFRSELVFPLVSGSSHRTGFFERQPLTEMKPNLLHLMKIVHAEQGRVKCEFVVEKKHLVSTGCRDTFFNFVVLMFKSGHPCPRAEIFLIRPLTTLVGSSQNRVETVHGGLVSTVVDVGGSLAVASQGLFATGVSTDLNVTFVAPAKLGEKDAQLVKLGKTLAFTTVELTTADGSVVAQGRHTKFIAKAHGHVNNLSQVPSTKNES